MSSTWIIDAFNLIRQSQDLSEIEALSLDKAKARLLSRLKNFSEASGEKIICVFDATGSTNAQRMEEPHGPVKFIYTKAFEIADEVIIEMARERKESAIIVSSDREIIEASEKAGSTTMKSQEFDRILYQLESQALGESDEEESGFDPKRGPKKKGSAFKRPKKDRKIYGKIKKWL